MHLLFRLIGILLLLPGCAATERPEEVPDGHCTGSACIGEATQVSSLLQKARSQTASTVLPDEDPLTDEAAEDLIQQEIDKIGFESEMSIRGAIATRKQSLMLEEDEVRADTEGARAGLETNQDTEQESDANTDTGAPPYTVPFDTTGYAGSVILSTKIGGKSHAALFYYKIDKAYIYLKVVGSNGFVGVGLNANRPSMREADIVVCKDWDGKGQITARDYHATHNAAPLMDAVQDWETLKGGRTKSGAFDLTWCEIRRLRKTCELVEDYQAFKENTNLYSLVAMSPPGAKTDGLAYHGIYNRKVESFSFDGAKGSMKSLPSDGIKFTIRAPRTPVSTNAGSYVCSYHKLALNEKKSYHIVNWKAIWDKKNSPAAHANVQHHMDMNACGTKLQGVPENSLIPCQDAMRYCAEVYLTGVNQYSAAGEFTDSDAGIAAGDKATMYVIISRHFYNPGRKQHIVDFGSHFEIVATPTLRPLNFLMLLVTTQHIKVPAQTMESVTPALCPHECTERLQGTTTIRYLTFHLHLAASRAVLRVIRNGYEIEPIMKVDPYDPAYQSARIDRDIVPGDGVLLECIYKNPSAHVIPYGEALEDEMCVATMSVVTPGSMRLCSDIPWGTMGKIPKPCFTKRGKVRPWPQCDPNAPMTYCPDSSNMKGVGGKPTRMTGDSHKAKFVEWGEKKGKNCNAPGGGRVLVPPTAGTCNTALIKPIGKPGGGIPSGSGGRSDESNHDQTSHSPAPGVIVGEVELVKDELKVSWKTDCNTKKATFTVEANALNVGWLAVGLLDGGTVAAPLVKPLSSMSGLDTIQAVPEPGGALKDGFSSGYFAPTPKATTVATFDDGGISAGKAWVTFTRDFASPNGLTLKEDGFVYLVAAYKQMTKSLDSKHTRARALKLKTSLFGGMPEYYKPSGSGRRGGPRPEGEPEGEFIQEQGEAEQEAEPEPEDKFEKLNKPITSGTCSEKVTSLLECWGSTANAGRKFKKSKELTNPKFPQGCFYRNQVVFFNKAASTAPCSATWECVCKTKQLPAEPEPEPEQIVPMIINADKCKADAMYGESDCLAMLTKVFGDLGAKGKKLRKFNNKNWPAGCFLTKGMVPFYNTNLASLAACGRGGVKGCVCKTIKVEKDGKEETKPYHEETAKCKHSNVVDKDHCAAKAAEYAKSRGLTIGPLKEFDNPKWPQGCWILTGRNKLFYNKNTGTSVECGHKGTWCVCQAVFELTSSPCKGAKIESETECQDAADLANPPIKYSAYNVKTLKGAFPIGCFVFKGKLWFNKGTNPGVCGERGTQCLCEK